MNGGEITLIASGIAAIGAIVVAAINVRQSRQLGEIHVLVNSNLATVKDQLGTALERIESLEATLVKERSQPPG